MCCIYFTSDCLQAYQATRITLSDINEWLRLFGTIVSIILLFLGVKLINDLRLRGIDAICGFHARLRANLIILKRASYLFDNSQFNVAKNDTNYNFDKIASLSAFMWLSIKKTQENLKTEYTDHFSPSQFEEFIRCAHSITALFEESNGQIPLSKEMHRNMNELYIVLLDIKSHKENSKPFPKNSIEKSYTTELLNNPKDIIERTMTFDKLIDDIVDDIDKKTERLLKKLWKKLR